MSFLISRGDELKKYIYIILFVSLASMLAVGCTGSNTEKIANQDAAWNESFYNNLALLHTDINNSINAMDMTDDLNDASFITSAQNTIDDSQNALSTYPKSHKAFVKYNRLQHF